MDTKTNNPGQNNQITDIQSALSQKEYEKAISLSQTVLNTDPTNQVVLSLMKEAHEGKTNQLRTIKNDSQDQALAQKPGELNAVTKMPATNIPPNPINSNESHKPLISFAHSNTPDSPGIDPHIPAITKPETSPISTPPSVTAPIQPTQTAPKAQTLEEIFGETEQKPVEKIAAQPTPDLSGKISTPDTPVTPTPEAKPTIKPFAETEKEAAPPPTATEPNEAFNLVASDEGESEKTNSEPEKLQPAENDFPTMPVSIGPNHKQKIINLAVKLIIAVILVGAGYWTYTLYFGPNGEEITPEDNQSEDNTSDSEENSTDTNPAEDEEFFTDSEELETNPTSETDITNDATTEETDPDQPRKVRRVPLEETTPDTSTTPDTETSDPETSETAPETTPDESPEDTSNNDNDSSNTPADDDTTDPELGII